MNVDIGQVIRAKPLNEVLSRQDRAYFCPHMMVALFMLSLPYVSRPFYTIWSFLNGQIPTFCNTLHALENMQCFTLNLAAILTVKCKENFKYDCLLRRMSVSVELGIVKRIM